MVRALLGGARYCWAVALFGFFLLGQVAYAHRPDTTPPLIPHGAQSGDLIFRKGVRRP